MHHQKGRELSFNEPMLLPASLQAMHRSLARARGEAAIGKAATAIIKKYCDTYEPGSIQADLQRLIRICGEQQNLCLFYEFTLLMLEALYALHGREFSVALRTPTDKKIRQENPFILR